MWISSKGLLYPCLGVSISIKAKKYELNSTKLWLHASALFDCIAACLFLSQKWKDSWIYLPESAKGQTCHLVFSEWHISVKHHSLCSDARTYTPSVLLVLENYVTAVWRGYRRKMFSWQKPLPGSLASFFFFLTPPLFCILSGDSATPACVIFHQTFHLGSTAHLQRREKP